MTLGLVGHLGDIKGQPDSLESQQGGQEVEGWPYILEGQPKSQPWVWKASQGLGWSARGLEGQPEAWTVSLEEM